MVKSFQIALEVVFPIFCLISIGYLIQRLQLVKREVFLEMNKLVFMLFLPMVIFKSIINSRIEEAFNGNLILFCMIAILVVLAASMFLVHLFEKDPDKKGVMVLAMFRSNFALFGLPIVLSLYSDIGITSIMIACLIPFLNVLGVSVMQVYRGVQFNLRHTLNELIHNPLIIAAIAGILFLILNIHLPDLINDVVITISDMASPMALIVLGGVFQFHKLYKNIGRVAFVVGTRLVLVPVAVLSVAAFLGYRGIELISMMVLFGSPVAVSVSPMAMAMKGDYELACQVVFVSTMLAIFTVFLWVFLFQSLGWIVA